MLMSNEFVNDKHRRELLRDQYQSKSTSKVTIDPDCHPPIKGMDVSTP
jgi:hypothetical protein